MNERPWSIEITPERKWLDLNLRELWRYRDLVMMLVRRDFVSIYKQTILGPIWFLLQPLMATLVFVVVFGRIIGISTGDIPQPLFYLSGIIVWNYFASCLTRTANTLVANAGLFGKVYFPRLAVPVSILIMNFLTFLVQFAMFLVILGYFHLQGAAIKPGSQLLLLPVLVIQMAALGLGVGILVSALTTKYRDLAMLTGFAVQLWMYATPIVYPLNQVPVDWRWLFALNPMTTVVETFRAAFLGGEGVDSVLLAGSLLTTGLLFLAAVAVFNRVEKTFIDNV